MSIISDNNKNLVRTGKGGKINAFYMTDFQYTILGRLIIYRLMNNRDIKIVITGKGKSTGTGKTTLAILLAKWVNSVRNDLFNKDYIWKAKDYAFMDVYEYLEKYSTANKGDCLITDELEFMADRRRSMTHKNVYFSEAWQVLRYRNVVTIGTCPHLSDVDKRIPETADIWINVVQRGRGNVYYMQMNDFDWNMEYKRTKILGYRETIRWKDLDNDKDYQWLSKHKEDLGVPGISKEDNITKEDIKKTKKEIKRDITIELLKLVEEKDLKRTVTQADIGDAVGYSQQNIAKIKREEL